MDLIAGTFMCVILQAKDVRAVICTHTWRDKEQQQQGSNCQAMQCLMMPHHARLQCWLSRLGYGRMLHSGCQANH